MNISDRTMTEAGLSANLPSREAVFHILRSQQRRKP